MAQERKHLAPSGMDMNPTDAFEVIEPITEPIPIVVSDNEPVTEPIPVAVKHNSAPKLKLSLKELDGLNNEQIVELGLQKGLGSKILAELTVADLDRIKNNNEELDRKSVV